MGKLYTISIDKIELLALKKLAVICGALAKSLTGIAAIEQTSLTRVLVDVLHRSETSTSHPEGEKR